MGASRAPWLWKDWFLLKLHPITLFMSTVEASIDIQQYQSSATAASARAHRMVLLLPWAALFKGGKRGRDLCTKPQNHHITVSLQLEGIFKDPLLQLSCNEVRHSQFRNAPSGACRKLSWVPVLCSTHGDKQLQLPGNFFGSTELVRRCLYRQKATVPDGFPARVPPARVDIQFIVLRLAKVWVELSQLQMPRCFQDTSRSCVSDSLTLCWWKKKKDRFVIQGQFAVQRTWVSCYQS